MMRNKPVLGLASFLFAAVTLAGCENCNCFGKRAGTGYSGPTTIGQMGTTTTPMTPATTTPQKMMADRTSTGTTDFSSRPGAMTTPAGVQPVGGSSNYPAASGSTPAFSTPPATGSSSGFGSPSAGMSSPTGRGMPTSMDRTPGSMGGDSTSRFTTPTTPSTSTDGSNRFTFPTTPATGGTGTPLGSSSSLTPAAPPASLAPIPTVGNRDQ